MKTKSESYIANRIIQDCEKMNYHGEVILDLNDLEKRIEAALSEFYESGVQDGLFLSSLAHRRHYFSKTVAT
jgi:hypothetical protein